MIFKGIQILNVSGHGKMTYDGKAVYIPATEYDIHYEIVREGNIPQKPKATEKGWQQLTDIIKRHNDVIIVGSAEQAQAYPGFIYSLSAIGNFSMYYSVEQLKGRHL